MNGENIVVSLAIFHSKSFTCKNVFYLKNKTDGLKRIVSHGLYIKLTIAQDFAAED